MRKIVFDVAASEGGALTILNLFYKEYCNDLKNEYIFVVSTPKLEENCNVKVIYYPWVKKSWFHRVFFDLFHAPKILKKYNPDVVLSLQNINVIGSNNIRKELYMHQLLPFSEQRYSFLRETKYWTIKNVLGFFIKKSVKNSDKVIVQTKWIRDSLVAQCKISKSKIEIVPPVVSIRSDIKYQKGAPLFFYPANSNKYKNHFVIIDSLIYLAQKYCVYPEVIFTLNCNTSYEKKILKLVNKYNLHVNMIGLQKSDVVFDLYSKSVLLFPSVLETFGLPLLEAKTCSSPIIASDMPFAHEILDDYEKVDFFNPRDYKTLGELILKNSEV